MGGAGAGGHGFNRHLAAPARPLPREDSASGDHGGHAVAGRRAIAEIAARRSAALDLGGTDQVDRLQHPGPDLTEARMFGQDRTGDGGADAKTAIGGFLNGRYLGHFLYFDDHAPPPRPRGPFY